MDTKLFESLGLNHNEALVYVTLLPLGTTKTGVVLKKSGLNTGKIYEILESLKRKGLVSETEINNVKHFTTAPAEKLLEYVDAKKKAIEEEEKVASKLIPELEKLRSFKLTPSRIMVYSEFEGFKSAVWEATKTLKPGEEICSMGVRSSKGERFNRVWRTWADTTLPKNHERVLFSEEGYFWEYKKKSKYSQVRRLTSETPAAIVMFGLHTVLIIQYNEPIKAIIIDDELIATTFISLFEQLWKVAEEPK